MKFGTGSWDITGTRLRETRRGLITAVRYGLLHETWKFSWLLAWRGPKSCRARRRNSSFPCSPLKNGAFESVCERPMRSLTKRQAHSPKIRSVEKSQDHTGTLIKIAGCNQNERASFRRLPEPSGSWTTRQSSSSSDSVQMSAALK